jgi:type II secretory pathway pseudopilin PulG
MKRPRRLCSDCRAFTVVELLVVIAIVLILIGLLIPGLGHARETSRMLREQSAIRQQMTAYLAYTTTFKDKTLPAAPHWNWVHDYLAHVEPRSLMWPADPLLADHAMVGGIVKPWTWHLVSWADYPLHQVQLQKSRYEELVAMPTFPTTFMAAGVQVVRYGPGLHMTLAESPSFAMNGVYVGGAYQFSAFQRGAGPNPPSAGGSFYVADVSRVRDTSTLMVFASARNNGNYPGNWIVLPPRPFPMGTSSSYSLSGGWLAQSDWYDARLPPQMWGNIQPRYFRRAVLVMFDGHVEMLSLDDLRDMRHWSNHATTPDWEFQPAP